MFIQPGIPKKYSNNQPDKNDVTEMISKKTSVYPGFNKMFGITLIRLWLHHLRASLERKRDASLIIDCRQFCS